MLTLVLNLGLRLVSVLKVLLPALTFSSEDFIITFHIFK